MSYETQYDDLMPDTVTVEAFTGYTGTGASSYAAAKTIKCRIEQGAKKVVSQDGDDVVSMTRLLMKPTANDGSSFTPGPADRITMPAGYTPQAPPVIRVDRHNDEAGLHHWEVSL